MFRKRWKEGSGYLPMNANIYPFTQNSPFHSISSIEMYFYDFVTVFKEMFLIIFSETE